MTDSPLHIAIGSGQRNRYQHELDLVEAAVVLVAAGGARRVSLVVQHAAVILPTAQASAGQWGVVVRGVWRSEGAGCDLVVEPIA